MVAHQAGDFWMLKKKAEDLSGLVAAVDVVPDADDFGLFGAAFEHLHQQICTAVNVTDDKAGGGNTDMLAPVFASTPPDAIKEIHFCISAELLQLFYAILDRLKRSIGTRCLGSSVSGIVAVLGLWNEARKRI